MRVQTFHRLEPNILTVGAHKRQMVLYSSETGVTNRIYLDGRRLRRGPFVRLRVQDNLEADRQHRPAECELI